MANAPHHDILYQETRDAALTEARELTAEIEHLRGLLNRLEHRKKAVEDICNALGRWLEVEAPSVEIDQRPLPFPADQGGAVALTEEEVSLIAYPTQASKRA